jgi:hypothetical protein
LPAISNSRACLGTTVSATCMDPQKNWFGDSRPSGEQFLTSQSETVALKNATLKFLSNARFACNLNETRVGADASSAPPAKRA